MFYQNLIQHIKDSDRVLEIGPGASPHPRSDEFLELKFENETEEQAQFGHTGKLITDKKIHYYDGGPFPFADQSFDYIICSHVLEHVPDVRFFASELQRVAPKGYLEYPNIYYDYLFNFDVHLNFLKRSGDDILWMKKSASELPVFSELHKDFYTLLSANQFTLFIRNNRKFFFEGFEWENKINIKTVNDINTLLHENFTPLYFDMDEYIKKNVPFTQLLKILLQKITKRVK